MPDPMYRQIAEDLRAQIEVGQLPPGARLPTEIELRETYDASRHTIRDAIKVLTTQGLVETRPGQGTFVVERISPFVTTLTQVVGSDGSGEGSPYIQEVVAKRRLPRASDVRVEIRRVDHRIARELQLNVEDTVVSRHQRRYIDEKAWSLQTSFYPMWIIEQGAARLIQASNIEQGTVDYLKTAIGAEQAGWRDTLTVRMPDSDEARFFGLPDYGRVSVIETRRTAFDRQGRRIRLTVSVYPADRNEFAVNVGDIPADAEDPASSAPGQETGG
ncbi:MAG TPA: GntR family transcriptional regulator [Streptosporangiaceae bacterium]|nr:GntR family transcriptional regulator [Streptosporangiaceae bacterium]